MSHGTALLRDRLRALDPARAERQTRLIAALNARRLGDGTLAARIASALDGRAASGWIVFHAGGRQIAVAPLLIDGALVRLTGAGTGPDPAVAAQLLAAVEPLTVALETALGVDLHPAGLAAEPPADALLLRLDASSPRGAIRHRLIVALPPEGEVAAPALPAAESPLLATLRARWSAAIDTPPIPVDTLGTIAVGDLYLLGVAPLVARIALPGHPRVARGRLEPMKGSMTLQDEIVSAPTDPALAHSASDHGATDWHLMKVPATVEIDGGLLSARELAGLAPGSVLPVAGTGGALAVRVVAGGAVIGAGELVAVGDGFGVLFTSVRTDPSGREG